MSHDQPSQPEYLGDAPADEQPRRPRGRGPLLAAAALGVVGVVGVGGWAAMSLMSDGEQPAVAVPADALAYVSIDLDPSADQKLEALRIVQKFPALDEELGLDAKDDLRRWVFDESGLAGCDGASYDEDVAPWIGDRAAFAVLPPGGTDEEPAPVLALQVTDEAAAEEKLAELVSCDLGGDRGGEPGGFAVGDGHAVLAETTKGAEAALAAAGEQSLADTEGFGRWTGEVGDPGIVTAYVAPEAPARLLELAEQGVPADELDAVREMTRDFQGMAMVLRFDGGAVEVEAAAGGLPESSTPAAEAVTSVTELPASTGLAVAMAFPDGWLTDYLDTAGELQGGRSTEEMLAEAEAMTGLELPQDAETLLGESLSIAVDSSLDVSKVQAGSWDTVPAGVRVEGDPAEITRILDELLAMAGPEARMVEVEQGDGAVAVGLDPDYVTELAGEGSLGDDATFSSAVPDADRAGAVFFVSFDAGDAWVTRLVEEMSAGFGGGPPDPEVRRNLEALDALGASSWVDGEVQHGLLRLTTD